MKSSLTLCVFSTAVLTSALSSAGAQQFSIDWFKIDGGGGTSSGGIYSVSGTIGQPDAGAMTGGNFSLVGGFWSLISVVQTPGAPLLSITLNPQLSTINLFWPSPSTGFGLEENTNLLSTNWAAVAQIPSDNGTTKSVTVPATSGRRFYRLQK